METWKEFDQNVITHSAAHHLMAVDQLVGKLGYARVSDVAKALSITRGSASISLAHLKEVGLITQDENRHLRLSPIGQSLVDAIKTKRLLMQRLFGEVLGVNAEQAEVDACKMEHLLSNQTAQRMISLLRFFDSDTRAADFLRAWRAHEAAYNCQPANCPSCQTSCLAETLSQ